MEIEKLNRTQVILLTLLVSFVTSIATGIVTVSLLEQAPPGVTQTINRIVERTVERVVPAQGAAVVTKETTVVVKEDDLVTKSIESNASSIVSLFQKTTSAEGTPATVFVGWGIILDSKGVIATDSGIISDDGVYVVGTSDGKSFEAKTFSQDENVGIALIQASVGDQKYTFLPGTLGDADKLRLGQSVIAFGGKEKTAISVGIVSSLTPFETAIEGTTTTSSFVGYIDSNAIPPDNVRGGPLLNIFGEIVGMSVGEKTTRFVSENLLREKLATFPKAEEKKP